MKYLEDKAKSIESISDQIDNFKKENPQIPSGKVDELVKNVAEFCMQAIVQNQEFSGRPENGWWTIRDTFEIEIKDQSQLLVENRQLDDIQNEFYDACSKGDIEGIKEGLEKFARTNRDHDNSVLTDAASRGDLKTLKFFLEDDFVQGNYQYKTMVDFHNWKGTIFQQAYMYGQKEVLEYLINEHNVESTKEAKEALNWQDSQSQEMKEAVINMVEKKYLNFMLRFTLEDNTKDKSKPKM
jgi:hypothetical protein